MVTFTRHRYRYNTTAAQAIGVELHPIKDIFLLAPDATDIDELPDAECWLFTANPLSTLPPYVDLYGDPPTAEAIAAATAAGQQVCPTCGDWLPREWHEFECSGRGHHYLPPDAGVFPKRPTHADIEREFKRASHNIVGVMALIVVVVLVLLVLAVFGSELRP